MPDRDNDAPLLLDASRMVWRRWTGTRATGIDRICHAWMEHFATRSQAVIVHKYGQTILPMQTSQELFGHLLAPDEPRGGSRSFRRSIAHLALRRGAQMRDRLAGKGRIWLNPGHTGLDRSGLAGWCRQRGLRPVYLVHDLIPITHPQFCREGEEERHRLRMRTVLDTAYGVVANSAHTLQSLQDFAQQEGSQLPPSIVSWPGTPVMPAIQPKSQPDPTFVILGTIEARKNHLLLLDVWREMIASGEHPVPRLVIVGRRGWQVDEVFRQLADGIFGDRVIEAGPLDDQAFAELLAGARALLFPSFAEGYGIPLAEALSCGVPVIASDLPVFQEIGQGVPDLLSLDDRDAWRRTIIAYAAPSSPERASQLARVARFKTPDWASHFAAIERLIA